MSRGIEMDLQPRTLDGREYTPLIDSRWRVSTASGVTYFVSASPKGLECSCPAFRFRKRCRHVSAVATFHAQAREGQE
jgi:hypothetical protein